ncbi:hypothetical protein [uncultured Chitinophaga sp.]|uniref:hypothetical protein n=1 Tax=uncultured Chitinophaga sp. TaxID=339340 RepID=UPI0025F4F357|nr:hypothetical protein [uncultured Chitinophaga sp.]
MLQSTFQRIGLFLLLVAAAATWQSCSKDNEIQPEKVSLEVETASVPPPDPGDIELPPPPPGYPDPVGPDIPPARPF